MSHSARKPLTAEQRKLANDYILYAYKLIIPFQRSWPRHSDRFRSAAFRGLVDAAGAWDAARGVGFSTYARYRINGELQSTLTEVANEHTHPVLSYYATAGRDGLTVLEHHNKLVDRIPRLDAATHMESTEECSRLLRQLPSKHAAALRYSVLDGMAYWQIGEVLGVSKSRVNGLIDEAKKWLRDIVARERRRGST